MHRGYYMLRLLGTRTSLFDIKIVKFCGACSLTKTLDGTLLRLIVSLFRIMLRIVKQ